MTSSQSGSGTPQEDDRSIASKFENFDMHAQDIELIGGSLRYYEFGTGNNHIILLHGMGEWSAADMWVQWVDPLMKIGHVYAIDMPGFGNSRQGWFGGGATIGVVVDALREFMDLRQIPSARVVGHSAGGWFGAILAYESPDRVRSLVMLGSAGLNIAASVTGAPVTHESITASFDALTGDDSELSPSGARALADRFWHVCDYPRGIEALSSMLQEMMNPEVRKHWLLQHRIPYIRVPTIVAFGDGEGMEPYPTWNSEWEAIEGDPSRSSKPWVIPGAEYVRLDGASHYVTFRNTSRVLAVVEPFLK